MKTLYIISKGIDKPSDQEMERLENQRLLPRNTYLDNALKANLLDERYLSQNAPRWRRLFYRYLPTYIAQICEALFIQNKYDAILTHSEKVGLPLSYCMKLFKIRTPNILIISRITSVYEKKTEQKKWFFKQTKDVVSRYLIWSSKQREIAINEIGINPDKIKLLKRGIDQDFWKQESGATDTICSVGMEARDYPTLIEAVKPLDIPLHIATGRSRGDVFDTVKKLYNLDNLPENVTIGKLPPAGLRDLYARSRFTVISLIPTDSDNGLTAILESFSMGKPVICTRAEGQIDVIEDGVSGIMVPQGNPEVLRNAITELWNDPERCRKMGMAGRMHIEKHHTLEQFADAIVFEVEASVQEFNRQTRPGHEPAKAATT